MSDLSNCGCGCDSGCSRISTCNGFGNSSYLWIILLLIFCGGCGNGCFGGNDRCDRCGCGFGSDNSCIWIILLLIFCGGCGNGCC